MDKSFVISSIKFKDTTKDIEVYNDTVLSTDLLFLPAKNSVSDEYEIYGKIEEHMALSIELHCLQKQTQSIIASLVKYKPSMLKANNIYSVLRDVIHVVNFATLINALDEVLFNDCGKFETFWVQDKEYNLESLYYKQESWTDDILGMDTQSFAFNQGSTLNIDEGMFLIMMCNRWLKCLSKANTISENRQLCAVTSRFVKKVEHCLDCIFDNLSTSLCSEEELSLLKQLKHNRLCKKN